MPYDPFDWAKCTQAIYYDLNEEAGTFTLKNKCLFGAFPISVTGTATIAGNPNG